MARPAKRSVVFVRHRVNVIADLATLSKGWGVELDVRSSRGHLILTHDPHTRGDRFESYVRAFKSAGLNGPMIINVKEDGHEQYILDVLKKFRVDNFFFLDSTLPTLIRFAIKHKRKNFAVRVSEYEPIEAALKLRNKVDWVWLDCFSGRPASLALVKRLARSFRVCLVSPELQSYSLEQIPAFKRLVPYLDAICTKRPDLWQ